MKTVILDANTLYPAPLRDYLLHLAAVGLFKPHWTGEIQEEWIRNLLLNRPDLKRRDLEKTRNAMDSAFPDAFAFVGVFTNKEYCKKLNPR